MGSIDGLKWYTTFVFLIGTILCFADPITDALTLATFYKENHRQWFIWGLTFMIVPCFVYMISYLMTITCDNVSGVTDCFFRFLNGFNPFSPAWASLKALVLCLKNFKKLWRGEEIESEDEVDDVGHLFQFVKLASFMEAITESIPQFIIQLYVTSVQEEPVKLIQIISLVVSCLCLVWTFSGADEFLHEGEIHMRIKHKVLSWLSNLLFLTSRLFAICYFIMSYRGWIFVVLAFHSVIVALVDYSFRFKGGNNNDGRCTVFYLFFLFLHWIRDDLSASLDSDDTASRRKQLKRIQWLSNFMFVVENVAMILLFYNHSKGSRFALPITVYVCSASILGSTIRLIHFGVLLKSRVAPETYITNERFRTASLSVRGLGPSGLV